MDCTAVIDARLRAHLDTIAAIEKDETLKAAVQDAVDAIVNCFRSGGRVYFCGNGGSAADAQHLAAEFSGRFYFDRPVRNSGRLAKTIADYVRALANIQPSLPKVQAAENILQAFEVCREKGVRTIAMTGATGGRMKALADLLINIPSTDTPRIQEAHITVGHIICELVEQAMFGEKE